MCGAMRPSKRAYSNDDEAKESGTAIFTRFRRCRTRRPTHAAFKVFPRTGIPSRVRRSEEHTSELQSLMRISYAVFCLKKKKLRKSSTTSQSVDSYDT